MPAQRAPGDIVRSVEPGWAPAELRRIKSLQTRDVTMVNFRGLQIAGAAVYALALSALPAASDSEGGGS